MLSSFWYVFVVRMPFLFNVIVRSRKFTVSFGFSVFHFNVFGPKAFIAFSSSEKVAVFGSNTMKASSTRRRKNLIKGSFFNVVSS